MWGIKTRRIKRYLTMQMQFTSFLPKTYGSATEDRITEGRITEDRITEGRITEGRITEARIH